MHTESDQKSLREVLRLQYVRSVVEAGAALQRKIGPVQREIARSSTINIFHTNSPIASALSKRWFQLMLLLLGASYLGRVGLATEELKRNSFVEAARYRFTALELRSGAVTDGFWEGAEEWEFGVMFDHCQQTSSEPLEITTEGASQIIAFPTPIKMNGWYLVTSESQDPELDPVKFLIEAEVRAGAWKVVGASVFRRTGFGEKKFMPGARFDTPTRRGATVKVDTRPSWEWYIGWMCSDVLIAFGMILAAALGVKGSEIRGKVSFELTWVLSFFFRVAPAISYLSMGQYRHCFEWWCWSVFSLLFPLGLMVAERSFITVVLLAGILLIVVQTINEALIFEEDEWFKRSPPYLGITLCVLGSFFLLFRMYILGRSRRFITEDKRVYDSVWETLLEEPEIRSALVELKSLSAEIQHLIRSNSCHARQYNRQSKGVARESSHMRNSTLIRAGNNSGRKPPRTDSTINVMGETYRSRTGLAIEPGWVQRNLNIFQFLKGSIIYPVELSIPGSIDEKRPVTSLDQLYAQAAGMNVVLKGKVQQWALRCNGMFQLKNLRPAIFVRWADAANDEQTRRRIKWGEIKTYNRAIEKLLRSYRSDVSQLCDLCRQTIVFEDLNELIGCLYTIGSDKQIVVCRIKNRLDPNYDARMTAGHRSVVLNVRVVARETKRLGLETHVSEVQLVLRQLQELQNEEAHARYIQFRNNYPYKRQEPSHLYDDMVDLVHKASRRMSRRRTSLLSTDSLRAADGMRRLSLSSQEGPIGTHERREEGGSVVIQTQRQLLAVRAEENDQPSPQHATSGSGELERDDSSDVATPTVTPTGGTSAEVSEIAPSSDGRRGLAPIEEIFGDEDQETMSNPRSVSRNSVASSGDKNQLAPQCSASRFDNEGGADTFDLQALFEAQYVKSTVQAHGTMEIRKSRVNDAMALVSTESVFFTSKAAVAAIGKLRWQVLLAILATLYLYRGIEQSILSPYGKSGEVKEFSKYRLTALELRGGGSVDDVSGPQVAEFGVMLEDCRQTTEPLEITTAGASQTISFSAPVRMNGWYLVTSDNDPDMDPVRFTLEGQNEGDPADEWEEVGASRMRVVSTGQVKLLNNGKTHLTKERGAVEEWSLEVPWSWVIAFPVVQMVTVAATYLFILCGITSQSRYANRVLLYGFLFTASLQLTSGVGYSLAGDLSAEGLYWCLFSLSGFAMASVLALAERYFILCLTICGVYLILLDICKNTVMFPDIQGLSTSPPFTGLFFVLVGFIANVFHHHILRKSSRLINEDKRRYDAVWQALIASERNTTALKNLTKTIDRVCAIRPAQLRQFNHRRVLDPLIQSDTAKKTPFLNRALSWVSASRQDELKRAVTVNIDSPVQCLDQLFVQSAGMDLILRNKVQEWASKSNGCFRIKDDVAGSKPLFFKWKDIKNDPHLRYNVKYGRLKGIDRAIEKLLRSYDGDVSLLLDVCRQSIVFDEIKDMTRCIHIIAEDADVAVARIKNRYDLEADSEATAGYRQVVLNLRIRTELAKSLALETHVCEVQLLLRQFAEIKDDEHHGDRKSVV